MAFICNAEDKTFDPGLSVCLECEKAVECFKEYCEDNDNCFLARITENGFSICHKECPEEYQEICKSVTTTTTLKKEAEGICSRFPKNTNSDECLMCPILDSCQAADMMGKDLMIELERVEVYLKEEPQKMLNDPKQCFGNFSFKDTCVNDCDWYLSCRHSIQMVPGTDCRNFNDNEVQLVSNKCEAECPSFQTCSAIIQSMREELEEELKERLIFTRPFSLKEIRKVAFLKEKKDDKARSGTKKEAQID